MPTPACAGSARDPEKPEVPAGGIGVNDDVAQPLDLRELSHSAWFGELGQHVEEHPVVVRRDEAPVEPVHPAASSGRSSRRGRTC